VALCVGVLAAPENKYLGEIGLRPHLVFGLLAEFFVIVSLEFAHDFHLHVDD
jgi:hypothetical protein